MAVKVAINGFGRIGRLAFRQMFQAEGFEIVAINEERKTALQDSYDPIAGIGCCGPRVERELRLDGEIQGKFLIPQSMAAEQDSRPCSSMEQWQRLRIKHDFEYWCATCVTILDKVSGRLQNMVLNQLSKDIIASKVDRNHPIIIDAEGNELVFKN